MPKTAKRPTANKKKVTRTKSALQPTTFKTIWKAHRLALSIIVLTLLVGFGVYQSYQVFWAKAGTILDNKSKVIYSYRPDGSGYDADYACYSASSKTLQAAMLADSSAGSDSTPLVRGQVYGGPGMVFYGFAFYGPKSELNPPSKPAGQLNFGPARTPDGNGNPVYIARNYSWVGGPTGTTFTPGSVPLVDPATGQDNYLVFTYQIRGTWQLVNITEPISLRSIPTCEGGPSLDGSHKFNAGTSDAQAAYDNAVSNPTPQTNPNAYKGAPQSASSSKTPKTNGTSSSKPKTNGTK